MKKKSTQARKYPHIRTWDETRTNARVLAAHMEMPVTELLDILVRNKAAALDVKLPK